jgi:hypothetical protein
MHLPRILQQRPDIRSPGSSPIFNLTAAPAVAIPDAGNKITSIVVDDEGPWAGGNVEAERMGIVAEAAKRYGGFESSELDCGWKIGDLAFPETLDDGLDNINLIVGG